MDAVLVAFIAGWIFGGWRTGLLKRLIGIGFMVISFVVSAYLRYPIGAIAVAFFKGIPTSYANLVGYTIAFPVILAGLHLASGFLLRKVSMTGITKELDQALGAVVGGIEGILIISAAIVILDAYFGTGTTLRQYSGLAALRSFTESFNASTTVHILRGSVVPVVLAILGPLLPKDIKSFVPSALPSTLPIPTR
jgi:uncharacterized membrane protein required for colicin V production